MQQDNKVIQTRYNQQSNTCTICYQQMDITNCCLIDCQAGHIFHKLCITKWVKKSEKTDCPFDRSVIKRCIYKGKAMKIDRKLLDHQICFICNQQFDEPLETSLKCIVCLYKPCHKLCMQQRKQKSIPADFTTQQMCQICVEQLPAIIRQRAKQQKQLQKKLIQLQNKKMQIQRKRQEIRRQILENQEIMKQLQWASRESMQQQQ